MARGRIKYGNKGLEISLKEFEKHVIKEVKRIVAETAEMIHAQAVALAPTGDGNLKASIEVQYIRGGLTAIVRVGAGYAIYVEYGTGIYATEGNGRKTPWVYWSDKLNRWVYTRGMHAQPFWNPALDVGRRYFQSEMKKLG